MGLHLLITGTDTAVGKTVVACALARTLRSRGLRVGVMKPAETGCDERGGALVPADALSLLDASGAGDPLERVCPYRYRSPLAPAVAAELDGLAPVDLGRVAEAFGRIAQARDIVLVEGAGGLGVPITWEADYADLALKLGLEIVLVVANRLGALNATRLSLDYAERRRISLRGYVLNDVTPDASPAMLTNARALGRLVGARCLGRLGYAERTADGLLAELWRDG